MEAWFVVAGLGFSLACVSLGWTIGSLQHNDPEGQRLGLWGILVGVVVTVVGGILGAIVRLLQ